MDKEWLYCLYCIVFLYCIVQSLSCVQLFVTPWTGACQASLSFAISQSLLKLMSIVSVMPSNHLILCRLLLLPSSILPSIRVFSNELCLCVRWPKYWSFNFSVSASYEYSVLISFRMDWFDLFAVFSNTTVQKHQFFNAQHHGQKQQQLVLCLWEDRSVWGLWAANQPFAEAVSQRTDGVPWGRRNEQGQGQC